MRIPLAAAGQGALAEARRVSPGELDPEEVEAFRRALTRAVRRVLGNPRPRTRCDICGHEEATGFQVCPSCGDDGR